jgi:toxin ParE1/3/4
MEVRWAPRAADDLEAVVRYIQQDDPEAAHRVAQTIYARAEGLQTLPHRGRPGRVAGTRELTLPPLPFIIVYRVLAEAVEIVRIIHGAQRWP